MHTDMAMSAQQKDYMKCLNRFIENARVMVHGPALQEEVNQKI